MLSHGSFSKFPYLQPDLNVDSYHLLARATRHLFHIALLLLCSIGVKNRDVLFLLGCASAGCEIVSVAVTLTVTVTAAEVNNRVDG